jgi:hypothetical protein
VVVAREVDIFNVACRVRRGATTLYGALCAVAGASSSLPTVESEMYLSTGGCGAACMSATFWTL